MADTDFDGYDSKVTFMFPGQGAQYMGMAATICEEVNNQHVRRNRSTLESLGPTSFTGDDGGT